MSDPVHLRPPASRSKPPASKSKPSPVSRREPWKRKPAPSGFLAETELFDDWRRRYNVSLMKAYTWLKAGLPSMKVGRERRVHTATADQWVRDRMTTHTVDELPRAVRERD